MYHNFCIHSSVEGHLGSFQLLAILNKAAMNIVEHVFLLPVGTFSGYMPRRGIGGSSGNTMSNFLRNHQTNFQSGCTSLQWAPNGGARENIQGAKEICNPAGATTLWTNQYPGALDSSYICIKRWPSRLSLEREAHWTRKLCMPQYRGTPGLRSGSGWVGDQGGKGGQGYSVLLG